MQIYRMLINTRYGLKYGIQEHVLCIYLFVWFVFNNDYNHLNSKRKNERKTYHIINFFFVNFYRALKYAFRIHREYITKKMDCCLFLSYPQGIDYVVYGLFTNENHLLLVLYVYLVFNSIIQCI